MKKLIFYTALSFSLLFTSCENLLCSGVKYSVGDVSVVEQSDSTYLSGYWPDGKICCVKKGSQFQLFWGEVDDVLTTADTPWPEDHIDQVKQENVVFGKSSSAEKITGFNENGSWLIGVFPLDNEGNYAGFFHAESHWSTDGVAYKSIGAAYSSDYGKTWSGAEPIIAGDPKPESECWSGLGDGCVIWNRVLNCWQCFYQGEICDGANSICMAVSNDPYGKSGTWKKWNGGSFTVQAYDAAEKCGGPNIPVKGLRSVPGANPSVMWNSFLGKYVMAYASWTKEIYLSFSSDGTTWSRPEKILGSQEHPVWYPNLISEEGDGSGGQNIKLYMSYDQDSYGKRKIGVCEINFMQ